MENMTRKVERMVRRNAKRRLWQRAVAIPAAIVVFITTYALILPAIAMEGETYCGFEAHEHTDECYTMVPACGYESGDAVESMATWKELDCLETVHQHTEDCYDEAGSLICGYADYLVHEHTNDCYSNGALVCTLPEIKEHVHTEECWSTEPALICGQAESEGHTHTDACYTAVSHTDLTCGLAESAGHVHSESCYAPVEHTYLACGQAESEGHIHGEGCYTVTVLEDGTEVTELTCDIPESEGHVHTDACYATETVNELVCGQAESEGHTHTDACYTTYETMELTCGQAESAGHTHTDACWSTEPHLVCGKPEVILHTHSEECLDEDGYLVCGQTEVRRHQHTEACFVTREQPVQIAHTHTDLCYVMELVCDKPEHVHTQACYEEPATELPEPAEVEPGEEPVEPSAEPAATAEPEITEEAGEAAGETAEPETAEEPVLICELGEHTHDEACYDETGALACGLEEHTHGEGCYAAAGETAEPEGTPAVSPMPEGEPPHAHEDAVVMICEAEEHVHTQDCIGDDGQYICGKVEHIHSDLCSAVATCGMEEHTHSEACYDENGGLICDIPEHIHNAECCGLMIIEESDAPIYNQPELVCGKEEHIHTNDCISSDLTFICGKDEHVHSADCYATPMKVEDGIVKSYNDGKVSVIAVYGIEANIPEEAVLNVYRLTPENPRYEARLAEAKALLNDDSHLVMDIELYNIGFYVNGVEVEPTAPVSVTFRFLDAARFNLNDNVSVVHFGENGTEVLEAESDQMVNAATFETNSFSDFALKRNGKLNNGDSVQTPAQNSAVEGDDVISEIDLPGNAVIITPAPGSFLQYSSDTGIANIALTPDRLEQFLTGATVVESGSKEEVDGALVVGQSYTLNLNFAEKTGTQFPTGGKGLTLDVKALFGDTVDITDIEEREGTLTVDDGTTVTTYKYTYWVENGILHVVLPEEIDGYPNFSFTQGLQFTVKKGNKDNQVVVELPGNNDLKFDVQTGEPEAAKTASEYDPKNKTVDYTVELKASGGAINGYTFKDTLENGPLTYGEPLEVTLKVYGVDEEGNEIVVDTKKVQVHPQTNEDGSESFEIDPKKLPDLEFGQRLEATYQAKLKDGLDDNGLLQESSTVKNTVELEKTGDDGFHLDRTAEVEVESLGVDKHSGAVEGENFLYWNVDIGNGSGPLGEITVDDKLDGDHTFAKGNSPHDKHAKHQNEGVALRVYDPKTGEVVAVVVIPWNSKDLQMTDKTMKFTIPDLTKKLPAGWLAYDTDGNLISDYKAPENYYLNAQYYTQYTKTSTGGTYKNDVEVTIHGDHYTDGSQAKIGPSGTINKLIANEDGIPTDGKIKYTIDIHNVIPTQEWEGEWYAPFRIVDELTMVGPDGTIYYVENIPQDLVVTLSESGSAFATLTQHEPSFKYDNADRVKSLDAYLGKDNGYKVRTSASYPYGSGEKQDSGTEVGTFYLTFNSNETNASNWDGHVATALHFSSGDKYADVHVEYTLPLNAKVYDKNDVKVALGENLESHYKGTVADLLAEGWKIVNKSEEEYYLNKSDTEEYQYPEFSQPVRKSGEFVEDPVTHDWYIYYTVEIKDVGANDKGTLFTHDDLYNGVTVSDTIGPLQYIESVDEFYAESWTLEGELNGRYKLYDGVVGLDGTPADGRSPLAFTAGQLEKVGDDKGSFSFTISHDTALYSQHVEPFTEQWPNKNDYGCFYGAVHRDSSGVGGDFDGHDYDSSNKHNYYHGWFDYETDAPGTIHSGSRQILKFTYRVKLNKEALLAGKFSVQSFTNNAGIFSGDKGGKDDCVVDVKNGGLDKTVVATSDGSEYFDFSISINQNRQNLIPNDYTDTDVLTMTDKMSDNLELLETSLKGYIVHEDGRREEFDLSYRWDSTTCTLTLDNIPNNEYVVIEYQARSKEHGEGVHITNEAKLLVQGDYSSGVDQVLDITESSGEGGAKSEAFVLHKQDASDETKHAEMKGATFLLYIISEDGEDPRSDPTSYGSPLFDAYGANQQFTFDGETCTGYYLGEFVIGETGNVIVSDPMIQSKGHYVLVEVKAPTGYMLPVWPNNVTEFYMEQLPEGVTDVPVIMNRTGYTIDNTNYNYTLPESGGEGTMLYTLGGIAMLSMAGAVFCARQRRKARGGR